ncbi:hypothetical protein GCM10029992_15870 [Glycomyces albus]
MISAVVIVCTAVLLGSILTVAYLVNRGSDDGGDTAVADESADSGGDEGGEDDGGEEAGGDSADAEGDPGQIAVTVVEIMYGLSDESPEGYICSDPGVMLSGDLESIGESSSESLGDILEDVEEFTVMDSHEQGETAEVEVGMVIYGSETSIGTIELIVEDGSWRACDFTL